MLFRFSSDESDLNDVWQQVASIKYNYYQLGVALGLPAAELDSIRTVSYHSVDQAFCAVLLVWLRQRYDVGRHGPPTWQRLVEAVDSSSNPALAVAIASRHPTPNVPSMFLILSPPPPSLFAPPLSLSLPPPLCPSLLTSIFSFSKKSCIRSMMVGLIGCSWKHFFSYACTLNPDSILNECKFLKNV